MYEKCCLRLLPSCQKSRFNELETRVCTFFYIILYIFYSIKLLFLVLIFHQIIDFQAKSELQLAYYERYCCKCCIQGIPSVRIFQIAF